MFADRKNQGENKMGANIFGVDYEPHADAVRIPFIPRAVFAGALMSLCIEILQLPLSDRTSDINDLILNISGVVIGYGIYTMARKIRRKAKT